MSTTKLDEYNNKMTELAEAIKEKNPDAPTAMTVSQMVDAVNGISNGIDQVQADWAQTDDTAVDFIKNKPELLQGPKGDPGQDGTTPQRGVDYWTSEDINTINEYIDNKVSDTVDSALTAYLNDIAENGRW